LLDLGQRAAKNSELFAAKSAAGACIRLMIATTNLHDTGILMTEPPTLQLRSDFETFVRDTYPGLVGVATALTGNGHDAQDMVQDTMLKAFTGWGRVQHLDHPAGWAHRVLVNRCVGWWRRRRTEANYLARLRREEAVSAGPSPESVAFWQAVRCLPARHQQVVALYYAADLSVDEVANVLTVPSGTVRSDLTRARATLATLLGE
jgi:RNA polymerase sigma-70 factor, ECF subfamily